MKKLVSALFLALLVSCGGESSSGHHNSLPSQLEESFITESFITESTISETTISEEVISESEDIWGIWPDADDIMRDPTAEELLLAPEITMTPARITLDEIYRNSSSDRGETSFEHMEEKSFNGLRTSYADPDSRGYSMIIYLNGEFSISFGVGLGLDMYSGFTSEIERAKVVHTMEIFMNYSVTDNSTTDVNDIVTVKLAEFNFQYALEVKSA